MDLRIEVLLFAALIVLLMIISPVAAGCTNTYSDCVPNALSSDQACWTGHYISSSTCDIYHADCTPDDPAYWTVTTRTKAPEIADRLDNDCNGFIDDEQCNGIDDDHDELIDEDLGSCLGVFVFVPACFKGSLIPQENDEILQQMVDRQFNAFIELNGLTDCKDSFRYITIHPWQVNLECPLYYSAEENPCEHPTWFHEAEQELELLGVPRGDYNEIITVSDDTTCPPDKYNVKEKGRNYGKGMIWVDPWGGDYVLTHEIGHSYGLADEYCSQEAGGDESCDSGNPSEWINYLGADLYCSPQFTGNYGDCCYTSCKNDDNTPGHFGCCMGNLAIDGPCIMGTGHIEFCSRCKQQLSDPINYKSEPNPLGFVPLQCGKTNPTGSLHNMDITFTITESGKLQIDSFDTYEGRSSLAGTSALGKYAIEIQKESTEVYHTNFDPLIDTFSLGGPSGNDKTFSFVMRNPIPTDVGPTDILRVKIYTDGLLTADSTFNGNSPIANAGPDQIVECTGNGQASATLDASASSDPDGDMLQYAWSAPGITFANPTGETTTAVFPLGTTTITLTVKDGSLAPEDTDTVQVTVQDTTPPVLTPPAATTIFTCKNPNIGTATAVDACGGTIGAITNNAPTTFPLGETTVTWTATDTFGNTITATQKVMAILGDDPSCCPAGYNIIIGTAGPDDLIGTFGNDCIIGLWGNDTLNGKKGNDVLSGGEGLDTLITDNGKDYLASGPGRDNLNAGNGEDTCVIDRTDNVVNCEKKIYYP